MAAADRTGATTFSTPSDREIVLTGVVKAPRTGVFDAWTEPEHLAEWFGPTGWTLPPSAKSISAPAACATSCRDVRTERT